jgi:hypothetical protein
MRMTEKEAVAKFLACVRNNDLAGAVEALKLVSTECINHQDDDDYDMLIQAVVNEDPCEVEALLIDNRCDLTHRENLCGMTAREFAMDYPDDSRIKQLFLNLDKN